MRMTFVCLTALGLAACTPTVPESGAGFNDYSSYMRQREAALNNGTSMPVPVGPQAQPTAANGFSTERIGSALDAVDSGQTGGSTGGQLVGAAPMQVAPQPGYNTGGDLSANRARGDAPAGIQSTNSEMVAVGQNSGISDEQEFSAVSSRETIESDKERLARNRAQYTVISPTAVPSRPGDVGPNIVEFAVSTRHAVGTPMYKRSSLRVSGSACAKYGSPDLAQEAFLAAGGPDKDRKGLDPDGDGFACSWDPTPFRAAVN